MMLEKNAALKDVELFVLDMDGTVYLGDNLIDGSLDFIHKVVESGAGSELNHPAGRLRSHLPPRSLAN